MPLKLKTTNGMMTLTWIKDDQTAEAAWRIPKDATDEEVISLLRRALSHIQNQSEAPTVLFDADAFDLTMRKDVSATTATTSASTRTTSAPTTDGAIHIPMGPPASLSDKPSDGGPPQGSMGSQFWESMPTKEVPGQLAMEWEMAPPEEMGGGW